MAKRKFWSSDKLLALTALFISLLTLFIFIWQTNIISKQSHLSVMPYLLLDSANNSQEMTFSIDFNNHGVGPAIIVKKEILYNGNTYDLEFYDFLQQHVPGMDSVNVINHSTMQNGLAIPSGNKRNVITVGGDMKSYQTFLSIMSELQKNEFHYEIVYKSIYDDRWVINSITNEPNAIE